MDYSPPDLCIRSLTEADEIGRYILDMPSRYDPSPDTPYYLEVGQSTIDYLLESPYQVPMCPPGWPNPPVTQ